EVPHFYASADIRMEEAVRLKEGLAGLGGEFEGITFTHLVLKAVGVALTRVPEVNASYDGDAIVLHDTVHVGLATAVEQDLVVPGRVMTVTLSCDHRIIDGVIAGRFLAELRGLLERPLALVV